MPTKPATFPSLLYRYVMTGNAHFHAQCSAKVYSEYDLAHNTMPLVYASGSPRNKERCRVLLDCRLTALLSTLRLSGPAGAMPYAMLFQVCQ